MLHIFNTILFFYSLLIFFPLCIQFSLGYFLSDLAMILWLFPALGGLEYVSSKKKCLLDIVNYCIISSIRLSFSRTSFSTLKKNSWFPNLILLVEIEKPIIIIVILLLLLWCTNWIYNGWSLSALSLLLFFKEFGILSRPISFISFLSIRFYTMGYPCLQSFSPS